MSTSGTEADTETGAGPASRPRRSARRSAGPGAADAPPRRRRTAGGSRSGGGAPRRWGAGAETRPPDAARYPGRTAPSGRRGTRAPARRAARRVARDPAVGGEMTGVDADPHAAPPYTSATPAHHAAPYPSRAGIDSRRMPLRMEVAVVVPNWNGRRWLAQCLESLAAQTRPATEVMIVDNGSVDGSLDLARQSGCR